MGGLAIRPGQCPACRWWGPHYHYPALGLCRLRLEITSEDHGCWDWEPVRVEPGRFYWCNTCRMRVSWEEARGHLRRGHRVYESAYVEPDVREEIVAAME